MWLKKLNKFSQWGSLLIGKYFYQEFIKKAWLQLKKIGQHFYILVFKML
jgi:hypothetical protein